MITSNYWSIELEQLDQMMPFRVRHILMIASLYDSFVFEIDGFLAEHVQDDFHLMNLTTQPAIYHASSLDSTMSLLNLERIDLIIIHLASMRSISLELVKSIKALNPEVPIFFLMGAPQDLMFVENHLEELQEVQDFFYWNGDSKLVLAIIKQWEFIRNIEHDVKLLPVPIILVVETFIPYYSQFMPLLQEQVMLLNQAVIRREHQDVNKTLYMNARPRVMLLHDYDSALAFYQRYADLIIGIISNVNYHYMGSSFRDGGLKLLQHVRQERPNLPFLLQSFNPEYHDIVTSNEGEFLYKDLPGLKNRLQRWLEHEIGFGRFIFRLPDQSVVGEAESLIGLSRQIAEIPDESLQYHFENGHIYNWLRTHAELALAKYAEKFRGINEIHVLRERLGEAFESLISYRRREKIQEWNQESDFHLNLIYKVGNDSIGGKGRGLAFLNVVLNRYSNICEKYPEVQISVPVAAVLATGVFDDFLAANPDLAGIPEEEKLSDEEVDRLFLGCQLPPSVLPVLEQIIRQGTFPLAVRSSSIMEDSIANPFAGVFRTYLIPNSHPDPAVRLDQLTQAIKLVWSSLYQKSARVYREKLRIPAREEKMAVIIQKVAGSLHAEHFYPLVSGVAQSYNFYPGTNMSHEDGVVTLSTGLGKTAVERERTFAFCPRFPNRDMFQAVDIVEAAQRHFYAIQPSLTEFDLSMGENSSLAKVRVTQKLCETDLSLLSSVWDYENREFKDGRHIPGPRVVTYRKLLHYAEYPLAPIIRDLLLLGREVLGCEIEMEFAFDVDPRSGLANFHLLQIRPIAVNIQHYSQSLESYAAKQDELVVYSSYALGSDIVEEVDTVIFIPPDRFDIVKTEEMAVELDTLNQKMRERGSKYVLIGPGRWGSSDRFLGIPVNWSQICNAQIIVEVVLPNMSIEASHGSHFFHNLFSMNVGYLTVWEKAANDSLDWDWLLGLETEDEGNYFLVKKTPRNLQFLFDGKNAVIIK
ncbi:MAG: PEP/pyruvate-binding domain-containing protein [Candidatus Cloacimonetes bacterium]|nr:PEP/pyruvate-binding domain-containing protein [Candidatus Cloacimonadota bacterium]